MRKTALLLICNKALLFTGSLFAQEIDNAIPVIPYPAQVNKTEGEFTITRYTVINVPNNGMFTNEAHFLNKFIKMGLGMA